MIEDQRDVPRATLQDVALAANVHPSTASRALRGVGRVHPDTIIRVRAAASQLGYFGNLPARLLQHRAEFQRLIAVTYDSQSMTGFTQNAQAFWFFLLLGLNAGLTERGINAMQVPLKSLDSVQMPIELLFVLSINKPPLSLPDAYEGIPLVVNKAYEGDVSAAGVISHDHAAITVAVCDHLRERLAHKIAMLPLSDRDFVSTATVTAYRAWCLAHSLEPIVLPPGRGAADVREVVRQAVVAGVDAIFAVSGEMAAVYDGVADAGLGCPDDVMIVGVGQGIMEPLLRPSLTSIFLDGEGSGRAIAALIGRLLETRHPERIELPWQLIPRGSTDR